MADVWVLLLIVAFFGVCVAFVRGCDAIVGPDDSTDNAQAGGTEAPEREPVGAA